MKKLKFSSYQTCLGLTKVKEIIGGYMKIFGKKIVKTKNDYWKYKTALERKSRFTENEKSTQNYKVILNLFVTILN